MKIPRLTLETTLFALAFVLALVIRLVGLGALPLGDAEATWAMQALDLARGTLPVGPQHPAYAVLTGALFSLLPADNALARLFPALAGSLLVLLPCFLRRRLMSVPGYAPAMGVLLAFALALDPGLVALSRTAGSPVAAAAFALLALATFYDRRPLWAGTFAALAVLSGPGVWLGALSLGLAALLVFLVDRAGWLAPLSSQEVDAPVDGPAAPFDWREAAIAAGITLLVCGTLFLRYLAGLGGIAAALGNFFQGWATPSGEPAARVLGSLLIYQALALGLGLVAWVRGWISGNGLVQRLGIWAVAATLVVVAYPARQTGDLVWALIPWWALAASLVADSLPASGLPWDEEETFDGRIALGHALLVALLLVVGRTYVMFVLTGRIDWRGWLIGVVVLLMAAVATALFGLSWSFRTAGRGLVWGIVVGVGVSTLAALSAVGQARPNAAAALWYPNPAAGQVDLLVSTLEDLSEWHTGERHELDVVALDIPSLRWALRNFRQASFAADTGAGLSPSVLITTLQNDSPALQASYRGQDFDWWITPNWTGFLPPDWLRWMAYGDAPVNREPVILWGRADLFPGGELASPLQSPSSPEEVVPEPENPAPGLAP